MLMSDKQKVQDMKETLVALTDTFEFLKEQDPQELKKIKYKYFKLLMSNYRKVEQEELAVVLV